jgi:predicted AAA+ superfamily ATPase
MIDEILKEQLRRMNEWWEDSSARPLAPPFRRHLVTQIKKRLDSGLAPAVVVRGSRQIGKTTSLKQLIIDLLDSGIPPLNIFWVQFDEINEILKMENPILGLLTWYEKEVIKKRVNAIIRKGEKVYFFLDEIQNIENWAPQLKLMLDTTGVKAVVTGSSALRIEKGRDSLAGRISTINAAPLSLTEIGAIRGMKSPDPYLPDNGLTILFKKEFWRGLAEYGIANREYRDTVFQLFSDLGAYPIAHIKTAQWPQIADQLNENIIHRVILHDLRLGEKGRKRDSALLEEFIQAWMQICGTGSRNQNIAGRTSRHPAR